jgi:hypothetical protein
MNTADCTTRIKIRENRRLQALKARHTRKLIKSSIQVYGAAEAIVGIAAHERP